MMFLIFVVVFIVDAAGVVVIVGFNKAVVWPGWCFNETFYFIDWKQWSAR